MAKGRFASSGVVVGQTPASQWGRRLQNQKGAKVTMGIGVPRQTEGAVGDITVREITSEGNKAYVKTNSGWVDINTMVAADRTIWADMVLAGAWATKSTYGTPQYFKDINGFVHFRGGCEADSGSYNSTITTLPEGFRPAKTIYRYASRDGLLTGIQVIKVQNTGVVSVSAQRTLDTASTVSIIWNSTAAESEVAFDVTKDIYLEGVTFFASQKIKGSGGGSSGSGGGSGGSGSGSGA